MKHGSKLLLIASIITAIWISSCTKEGDDEGNDPRELYVGSWWCQENSSLQGPNNYEVTIENDPTNSSQVRIYNFYNLGNSDYVYAIATERNLTVPSQTVEGNKISGTADYINKTKISWTYTVLVGGDKDNATATYTR